MISISYVYIYTVGDKCGSQYIYIYICTVYIYTHKAGTSNDWLGYMVEIVAQIENSCRPLDALLRNMPVNIWTLSERSCQPVTRARSGCYLQHRELYNTDNVRNKHTYHLGMVCAPIKMMIWGMVYEIEFTTLIPIFGALWFSPKCFMSFNSSSFQGLGLNSF